MNAPHSGSQELSSGTEISVGSVSVQGVRDGHMTLPPEFFTSPEAYAHLVDTYAASQLPIGAFLIPGEEPILVDAGLGPDFGKHEGLEAGLLLDSLAELNTKPADVRHLVLSHIHPDHTGWLATKAGGPIFLNAHVYAGAEDWNNLSGEGQFPTSQWIESELRSLHRRGQLTLVTDAMEIIPGVTVTPAAGHTPGHIATVIESEGQKLIIAGDAIYFPDQLTHLDWTAAHDVNKDDARHTRQWLADELRNGSAVVAPHFPQLNPVRTP